MIEDLILARYNQVRTVIEVTPEEVQNMFLSVFNTTTGKMGYMTKIEPEREYIIQIVVRR